MDHGIPSRRSLLELVTKKLSERPSRASSARTRRSSTISNKAADSPVGEIVYGLCSWHLLFNITTFFAAKFKFWTETRKFPMFLPKLLYEENLWVEGVYWVRKIMQVSNLHLQRGFLNFKETLLFEIKTAEFYIFLPTRTKFTYLFHRILKLWRRIGRRFFSTWAWILKHFLLRKTLRCSKKW